ncbi:sugar phosphate isomerase/epimerase family protein [uncultured Friedmanniella sp.]|uniref:sugar phosphate isomerase/epimerase family protein n=1 Tax=uncultured Friedmanniella sp. TaxID=335381 RepID=UPI0035CB408C
MSQHDLSVQLYTVRNALAEDFDGTLAKIAGFGYTQVEPFGFVKSVDGLRRLGEHGLTAPTTHMGLVVDADLDAIFEAAVELGIGTVIEPAVRAPQWQDEDGIRGTADALNAAAVKAAEHGLKVGYHNHWWEIERDFDGRHGLEVLADHLAPEVVLEVDTYWAHVGGADVPALLQRLGERVVALHVKDGDGSTDNKKQVAVGDGSLPVWSFIDAAPDALRVVELDDSEGDMLDAVRDSRTYLTAGKAA